MIQRVLIQAYATVTYYLVLNPMMGPMEGRAEFGPFLTKEDALSFMDAEKVETYSDQGVDTYNGGTKTYSKTFRKGGPLEWMNGLNPAERDCIGYFGHGVHRVLGDLTAVREIG